MLPQGFSRTWLAVHSYSTQPATTRTPAKEAQARRERLASFMSQLISRPARRDRVLDLTFCAEVTPSDFAAAALALRHTSMFSGLRLLDVPIGDSMSALCDYARTSKSLSVLTLSGVLPELSRLPSRGSPPKSLGEALAAGK